MGFVVEIDTCAALLTGNRRVYNRFKKYQGKLFVSAITMAELCAWAYRPGASIDLRSGLSGLVRTATVLDVDHIGAIRFGRERQRLLGQGVVMPFAYLFIACTALVYDYTVVTHDTKYFAKVPGLKLDDWIVR